MGSTALVWKIEFRRTAFAGRDYSLTISGRFTRKVEEANDLDQLEDADGLNQTLNDSGLGDEREGDDVFHF